MDRHMPLTELETADQTTAQPVHTQQPMPAQHIQYAQPVPAQAVAVPQTYNNNNNGGVVMATPVAPPGVAPPGGGQVVLGPGDRRPWWTTGICDCFAQCAPSCLMGFFCPCFQFARIKAHEDIESCPGRNYWGNCCLFFTFNVFAAFSPSTVITFLFFLFGTIGRVWMLASLRLNFRQRKFYEGSQLEDICCAFCCQPCTVSQMARESIQYDSPCECDCRAEFCSP